LADISDHLLWCFGLFLGRGLSAAKVSRQMSSKKMKMTSPQINPKLAPCSKPDMHGLTSSYAAAGTDVKLKEWYR